MQRSNASILETVCSRALLALMAVASIFAALAGGQTQGVRPTETNVGPPQATEGCLLYRSPVSGQFESVPLTHTDAAAIYQQFLFNTPFLLLSPAWEYASEHNLEFGLVKYF